MYYFYTEGRFISLLWHFWGINFENYFDLLLITDEASVPEMCIWSILVIKSDLKWCIHPN